MTTTNPVAALLELGFTETEARLYCELTRLGPATGYRLAKAIGKATANTYAALETLAQKGAAMLDEVESRTWRAVPAEELVAALEARHRQRSQAAREALADLKPPQAEARLYGLKSAEQVLARARAMIAAAQEIILFDLFPAPFLALKGDLERAKAHGVRVVGLTYEAAATTLEAVTTPTAAAQLATWPGSQVTVVVDGRQHVTALISRDGLDCPHGVWSDSAYLACVQHSGLAAEIILAAQAQSDPLAILPNLFAVRPPGLAELG
jgi:sugar-specific transcriptional regulator TrmB